MLRTPSDTNPAQETARLDWLSYLSFNQRQLCVSLFRSAAQDRHVKDAKQAIQFVRRELYARTARAWNEQEASAYAVSISLTVSMEDACLQYASSVLETYRRKSAPAKKQGRRAA